MRTTHDVFHLAIGVHDLDAAQHFYVTMLGCKLARRYPDRITLDFFGDQLVCHLTETEDPGAKPASLYPRHFGVTFRVAADLEALHIEKFRVLSGEEPRPPHRRPPRWPR